MATRYEYYNTGDDAHSSCYGSTYWLTKTFTPLVAHKIKSVKLLIFREGSPSTVTVGIRATDGEGKPTGADLCSGTTNGNTLPTGSPYEWQEITLGAGYDLEADTKYAIVVRAPSGNASNILWWRCDITDPGYAGGQWGRSTDEGSSWLLFAYDFLFEEWGEAIPTEEEEMPQFAPSEVKTARAPITIKPAGLSCSAELYLVSDGAKVVTSGIKPFTSTGVKQDISFPITMPGVEGAYPVYLDIFANGLLIGAYKATKDVVIAVPAVPKFYTPLEMQKRMYPTIEPYTVCEVWARVTNKGDAAGTHNMHIWDSVGNVDFTKAVTLQLGETYTWHRTQWIDFSRISRYTVQLQGDWEADNYSKAMFP